MMLRRVHLGPLSDLAASYLDATNAWSDPILETEAERRQAENDVIAAMIAIKRARTERRPFTDLEQELLRRAEDQVRRGVQPPAVFKPLPKSGRGLHQTVLSLADGGEGHLGVTLRDPDLLDGVVVHHEVICRSGSHGVPDSALAPYRMIDIRLNGIVRLHAADDVPVTVYCGRPNYQLTARHGSDSRAWNVAEAYRADPVTPSHSAAAMASAAFANGVADVKFNFDGLTVLQAVDFMRRVKESVDKRPDQYLSTQFNLNQALHDDRQLGTGDGPAVREAAAIARLTVEMTGAGGWDRVTIDSASDTIPSLPLVELLGYQDLVSWVDEAHAAGLETYISGGMSAEHIELATHAGVDGVGIGFWIHHYDASSRRLGPLDGEKVKRAIHVRNQAESSPRGVAARLLARLHAVSASGGRLPADCGFSREELVRALLSCDDERLVPIVERARTLGLL
jgi:uncharacterized protein (UPF0264 family)